MPWFRYAFTLDENNANPPPALTPPPPFLAHGSFRESAFLGSMLIAQGPTASAAEAADLSKEGSHGHACAGDGCGDVGVSEAEVLELTQRWSELRDRETFHLLALERAVHQVCVRCSALAELSRAYGAVRATVASHCSCLAVFAVRQARSRSHRILVIHAVFT